ncbi:MAG: hypothetical protein OEW58_04055 [Gammaproteobacteria bacterium]|nr:hypothetical protein [Gammaproteobacteria bacterium]
MDLYINDCEVDVDASEQIIKVTWGAELSFDLACSFILSFNLHKIYPSFGVLLDFRQVRMMSVLIHDLMRLSEVAAKVFDAQDSSRPTAFLVADTMQQERATQYIELRRTISPLDLQFACFRDSAEAVNWLRACR